MDEADRNALPEVTSAVMELLARQGYETTTVNELAVSVGMSRSTFFRRFGSKEDVVFADHDFLLARVEVVLDAHGGDAFDAVVDGARVVLDYHLSRPEVTRFRSELLHTYPALRDRELVTSSRYERAFSTFLRRSLPHVTSERDWVLVSYASAAVAVHNLALRSWLRGASVGSVAQLESQLRALATAYRDLLAGRIAPPADRLRRVVVAVVEPGQTMAHVLADVAESLERPENGALS